MQKAIIADNMAFLNTFSALVIIYWKKKKKVLEFGIKHELISFLNKFLAKENTWGFQAGLLARSKEASYILN